MTYLDTLKNMNKHHLPKVAWFIKELSYTVLFSLLGVPKSFMQRKSRAQLSAALSLQMAPGEVESPFPA
jgi:hypothetical protein